ncbi:type II toxin-antitoxin system RelE/ParE family toxin [Tautonia rosea]|uniref:type II toxin-antitoxin system RelE/ParE family toxin n=1 Tax=Tautonia rosea TaxID=2728037 RepID=UPI001473DF6D|nr:type II toxin-antitoxin system RelE/ParE family toxin [Tautonia rosea]
MTYRVIVTRTADAEAMEALRWYAERSPAVARRWYQGLESALKTLESQPTRCPVSEDDSEALGREIRLRLYGRRHGVFKILFSIEGETVWVLRIRHSARGPIEPEQ